MQFDEGWVAFFSQELSTDYFKNLAGTIQVQRNEGAEIYPPEGGVFNAFKLTPFETLKVVIVGPEEHSKPGLSHGLAYSTTSGVPLTPTLTNIYRELSTSLGIDAPKDGNLTEWAEAGILLLNSVLTVEKEKPESHKGLGWEKFTDHAISYISENKSNILFCFWGPQAQAKSMLVDQNKHRVLKSSSPSPRTVNQGFSGCGHFLHINQATNLWSK